MLTLCKARGATLIELMLGITIGLFVILAGSALYMATLASNTGYMMAARLGQDIDSAMFRMSSDIRRAGYNGAAASSIGSGHFGYALNPFVGSASGTPAVYVPVDVASAGCILFSYDLNKDGILEPATETFGFRLQNGAIQSRTGGNGLPTGCNDESNSWDELTDAKTVTITSLTFTLNQSSVSVGGGRYVIIRTLTINMTGQLPSDPSVQKTLTGTVRIRNDWIS